MTTQEIIFNEYKEEEGGWYTRQKLWENFVLSIPEKDDTGLEKVKEFFKARRAIEDALFSRCQNPEALTEALNKLHGEKLFSFIRETLFSIGFLNPAPKND